MHESAPDPDAFVDAWPHAAVDTIADGHPHADPRPSAVRIEASVAIRH